MLLLLLQIVGTPLIVIACAGFYFTRSSKSMPKNFSQLKCEIQWQIMGICGLIEDFVLRSKNHIELINQPGRVAVITGGNRGIGLRVVEKLLKCNMTVIMGVRSPIEAEENLKALIPDDSSIKNRIFYEELDVGSMKSVREFAAKLKSRFSKIDILINNAGVMACPYSLSDEGFESHLAINYLGHFLLTHLILPEIIAAGQSSLNARIVNVSSCIHHLGYIDFDDINGKKYYYPPIAYNQSKLAQIMFTKYVQKLFNKDNVNVQIHSVHPGVVDTDLFCYSSTTYIPRLKKLLFKNPEEGSRTVVYAAISPKIEGDGGTYMSNCTLVRMSSLAKDKELCEKFFKFTCEELLDIKEFGNGK